MALAIVTMACAAPTPPGQGHDAALPHPVTTTCVAAGEPQPVACAEARPLAARVGTVIDLRDPAAATVGRCDDTTDVAERFFNAYQLPTDPGAYPLVIRLSSAGFAGPCSVCEAAEAGIRGTTYGVGFELRACAARDAEGNCTDGGFDHQLGLVPAVRVSAPWTVGAGGCGEACPWPCVGGYQEFGRQQCLASHSTAFGVATDEAGAPDAEVYVDLVPWTASSCCPFPCP